MNTFKKLITSLLLLTSLFVLNACSYSPNMLKDAYGKLGSDFSKQLKHSMDLSPQQTAKVDHYVSELIKWHRQNKLPEYAYLFSELASSVQQDKPSTVVFQKALSQISEIPHFEEAKHLTPLVASLANSLTEAQISQLETTLNDELQKEKYEIKTQNLANDIKEGTEELFAFIDIPLNVQQKTFLSRESVTFQDLRWYELNYHKRWNDRLIRLLKQPRTPQFASQFAQIWDSREVQYTGEALQKRQQDLKHQAQLLVTIIRLFDQEQKSKLASTLDSMSRTFSELANR